MPSLTLDENTEREFLKLSLLKTNSLRKKKNDYSNIVSFEKKSRLKVKTGKNSTSVLIYKKDTRKNGGKVGIVTAGTSDIGIAEEARLMCEAMNCTCICSYDIGIAGMHRMFHVLKKLIFEDVSSIIVVDRKS